MNARDELTEREALEAVLMESANDNGLYMGGLTVEAMARTLLAAGYRKAGRVTEYGTVINRRAAFLTPPAESLEEFKERYVHEGTWMLTERDPIITRTFLRCDPEPSAPEPTPATVLHEPEADQ